MDKTILVTGSSRGIGRAIALELAAAGYPVVVHCRSAREQADEVCQRIATAGGAARVLQFDVADRAQAGVTTRGRHGPGWQHRYREGRRGLVDDRPRCRFERLS